MTHTQHNGAAGQPAATPKRLRNVSGPHDVVLALVERLQQPADPTRIASRSRSRVWHCGWRLRNTP